MKKFLILVISFLSFCYTAQATIIDFEDVATNGGTVPPIQNGYYGLNWNGINVINPSVYAGGSYSNFGYGNGTTSGNWSAFNTGDNTAFISISVGEFDWNGAYFTAAYASTPYIHLEGYKNGVMIESANVAINNLVATWYQADWTGVDELILDTPVGLQFVMDDFAFNVSNPIPEPATIVLLGIGLAGLAGGAVRRRFKRGRE